MKSILKLLRLAVGARRYYHWRTVWRAVRHDADTFTAKGGELSLSSLGHCHGTDKADADHTFAGLTYLDVYERYLRELPSRGKDIAILEIGVREGASLRMWSDWFPDADICGFDIDPSCKRFEESRIRIAIGSQDDPQLLRTAFPETSRFDLIVDDGSHINSMTLAAFDVLFAERLKPGGLYIIEDLGCSYDRLQTDSDVRHQWPGMHYNREGADLDNDREDMDRFFLDRINDIDHLRGDILFLHFWSRICILKKRSDQGATTADQIPNPEPSR
tara:strand:+ start:428 stop:1249 length:822 start_codon:yes stop_codon:yes gene_type:complete